MSRQGAHVPSPAGPAAAEVHSTRRVTWLELFFDLVFVAAVSQVGTRLTADYSFHTLGPCACLLLLIWWAWSGYALFATRFDANETVNRAVTFVQMIAVIFMAANADGSLDSPSSAGFVAAYGAMRMMLAWQYLQAGDAPQSRAFAREQGTGIAAAASIWLASALAPTPPRYALWLVALSTELATAVLAARHTERVPPDAAHLPERFGLFTLILIGESIVAVMKGIQSQPEWPVGAASAAFLGIGVIFVCWWWYFEVAAAAAARPVRCRCSARRFHIWTYTHLPLYLGLALTAIGIEHIVRTAGLAHLGAEGALILGGGVVVTVLALSVLGATAEPGTVRSQGAGDECAAHPSPEMIAGPTAARLRRRPLES
jgi:low temperature requirement protein LtrA